MAARHGIPPEHLRRFGGGAVAPFSQMLMVGLVICALSLPVITALPALAAGSFHLDRHLRDGRDSWSDLGRLCWAAVRTGWPVSLAICTLSGLLLLNVSSGVLGLVPGGMGVAVTSGLIALIVSVAATRAAGLWSPGASWPALLRAGALASWNDPVGTVFVLLGYGVSAVVVWMLPPLVVIAPGMLAITLVAAERRRGTDRSTAAGPRQAL